MINWYSCKCLYVFGSLERLLSWFLNENINMHQLLLIEPDVSTWGLIWVLNLSIYLSIHPSKSKAGVPGEIRTEAFSIISQPRWCSQVFEKIFPRLYGMRVGKKPPAFLSSVLALWFTSTVVVDLLHQAVEIEQCVSACCYPIGMDWVEKFHRGVERTSVVLASTSDTHYWLYSGEFDELLLIIYLLFCFIFFFPSQVPQYWNQM